MALNGSLLFPLPLASRLINPCTGEYPIYRQGLKRVAGATRIEPIAEEIVAAARPIGIIGPQIAILLITN